MASYFAPMKKAVTGKNKMIWIIGGVILFAFFYYAFSKQVGSSKQANGGGNIIVQGPSDAELLAAAQNNAIQTQASVAMQQAGLESAANQRETELAGYVAGLQFENAQTQIASDTALATLAITADMSISSQQIDAQLQALALDNNARANSEMLTRDIAMTQIHSQENMFISQLENNRAMFETQVQAVAFQSLTNQIGNLKKKDRDTALGALIATQNGVSFGGGKGDDRLIIGAPIS